MTEDEDLVCHKCGTEYSLRDGCEPTAFCDDCAHGELQRLREQIEWLWANCKIVYWPRSANEYPIEHNPYANKDSRQLIEERMK